MMVNYLTRQPVQDKVMLVFLRFGLISDEGLSNNFALNWTVVQSDIMIVKYLHNIRINLNFNSDSIIHSVISFRAYTETEKSLALVALVSKSANVERVINVVLPNP